MSKKRISTTKTSSNTTTAASTTGVKKLRTEVDRIDKQLVQLISQRAEIVTKLAELKVSSNTSAYDWTREEEVLKKAEKNNPGPLPDQCIRAIFSELISGSRALQTKIKAAFLGPEYSYSHQAALIRFGRNVDYIPVSSITAVFEEVESGQSDFGLVPMENSTDGRISDTLDNFCRTSVQICGEVQLRIHHNLLSRCVRSKVQEVYSKPQALSQCRNWLSKHLPQAKLIEVTSTSIAAKIASEKNGAAAIASSLAATHYGLDILAKCIEDNQANLTRFSVIGHTTGPKTGDDKSTLMFELAHQSGSLSDAIAIFKRNKINLTWIESFPMPGPDSNGIEGAYLFFVELEGHQKEAKIRRAIASLEKKVVRLQVLGSYPRMEPAN